MENATNGKVEEALQKVEEGVREDAQLVIDSVKVLVKDLVDGDSQPVKKEAGDREGSESSSSSSDGEKEQDPSEQTENPGLVVAVEETVEEISEKVVDSTVAESERSGDQEKMEVSEAEVKEEEVAIVASSEVASGVDVTEVVTEQISETTVTTQVETKAEPAPTCLVLPVEEEMKGNLAPKGSEDSSVRPPENVPAAEQIPENAGNPVSALNLMSYFRD